MKIVAIIALCVGIGASAANIVLQIIKMRKVGQKGKFWVGSVVFAVMFIIIAVVNLIVVIPALK